MMPPEGSHHADGSTEGRKLEREAIAEYLESRANSYSERSMRDHSESATLLPKAMTIRELAREIRDGAHHGEEES